MKPASDSERKPRRKSGQLVDRRLRVSRAALHDQAASRLRNLIVRGTLEPGEQLNEAELSEALGVSRTPLREALKLLAAEGLVVLRHNRSGIVAPFRRSEIDDLFEAVSGIERIAAELAALRMTAKDLTKLRSLQARMERYHSAGQVRDYFEVNQQIHGFIVGASRNETLKAAHQWLLARVERARFFALSSHDRWDESVQEHREVLAALERRDAEAAGKLLAGHVQRTGQVVNGLLHIKPAPESEDGPAPDTP